MSNSVSTHAPSRILAIIVNWNKKPFLDALLTQIDGLDLKPDEIVVVDNASTDGSLEMLRTGHPNVKVLAHEKNLGGSGGFNAGMRWGLERGGFDYFWLLDNDVVAHRGVLSGMLQVAEEDSKVGMVGSRIAVLGNPEDTQEIGAIIEWPSCRLIKNAAHVKIDPKDSAAGAKVYDADYVASCSLLARVKAIEEVGIWDEGYFIFFDDIEWGIRFGRAGWKVKAAAASLVEHESFHNRRFVQPLELGTQSLRNGLHFFRCYTPWRHRPTAFFYTYRRILTDILNFITDGRREIAASQWAGISDFLLGRRGFQPHKFKRPAAQAPGLANPDDAQAVPCRKRRILYFTFGSPELIRQSVETLKKQFPNHEVDVLLPSEVIELPDFKIEGLHRRPMRGFWNRVAAGRWVLDNYDATARPDHIARYAFEMRFPANILVSPLQSLRIVRNHFYSLPLALTVRAFIFAGAAVLMLASLLKPMPKVNFFTWNRKSSRETPSA